MNNLIYLEFGVVIVMLGITVVDLARAVIWEVQDLIEEWRDINDVE